jgi:hypothetical protein
VRNERKPAAGSGQTVHEGRTFLFCGSQCKTKFDVSPEKHAGESAKWPKIGRLLLQLTAGFYLCLNAGTPVSYPHPQTFKEPIDFGLCRHRSDSVNLWK